MHAQMLVLACVAGLIHGPALAGVDPSAGLRELGRHSPGLQPSPAAPFAVADFDGDGVHDIIVASAAGADMALHVFGIRSGEYVDKQWFVVPAGVVTSILVHPVDGMLHLFVFGQNGTGHEFAGWPLQWIRSFDLGPPLFSEIRSAAIGDADNDGQEELIISSFQGITDYDLATLQERWLLSDRMGDLLLKQLDGDPALEIVVSGTPLEVIDGATRAIDWSYEDGFTHVLSYAMSGSPAFLAFSYGPGFTVFGAAPWSPLWDAKAPVGALDAYDLDGDGNDEVIVGENWFSGNIDIFDGQAHEVASSFPFEGAPTSAIGAVDLDGDGAAEIAHQSEQIYADGPFFALYDAQNGSILWRVETGMDYPYVAPSLSVGPGALQVLYGSATYDMPHWERADAWTGVSLWNPASGAPPGAGVAVASVALPDIGDQVSGILLGESDRIVLIDDAAQSVRWSSADIDGYPFGTRELFAMELVPNPTGAPDTGLACAHSPNGTRLFTFALASGQFEWESVNMQDYCRGTMAGDFGGVSLLVAVLQGSLRAYDASTHLLVWSLPVAADGATLLDGADDREFVMFSGSQLVFRDAATRDILREFDLGEQISAVRQLDDIHALIVAADGRLHLVDGATGDVRASSHYLGFDLGTHNQLAVSDIGGGTWLVVATTSGGVFRYLVSVSDAIFGDGFEG